MLSTAGSRYGDCALVPTTVHVRQRMVRSILEAARRERMLHNDGAHCAYLASLSFDTIAS